jgi:hypothetical protein
MLRTGRSNLNLTKAGKANICISCCGTSNVVDREDVVGEFVINVILYVRTYLYLSRVLELVMR